MPDDDISGSWVDVGAYRETLAVKSGNRLHEAEGRDWRTSICSPPGATPILCVQAFESPSASRNPLPRSVPPMLAQSDFRLCHGRSSSAAVTNAISPDDDTSLFGALGFKMFANSLPMREAGSQRRTPPALPLCISVRFSGGTHSTS